MHLPSAPASKEPSTSSRPKSMTRSERPNWPPENLTHLHQVPKVKTSRDVRLSRLALRVEAIERLLQTLLGGLARIDRTRDEGTREVGPGGGRVLLRPSLIGHFAAPS